MHEACLSELSSCPTIGCQGLGLEALELPCYGELLDRAEALLRRAQADPDSGLLEQAQRNYAQARENYRESDRAHFQIHGVELHATVPTRPLRDQTTPRPDRWELPVAWPLVSALAFVALATYLYVNPGIKTLQEAVFLACGITLLGIGVIKGALLVCESYAAGSPYR